jgi:hypothetical protein
MRKTKVRDMDFCLACGENHGGWPYGGCANCGADPESIATFVGEHSEEEE